MQGLSGTIWDALCAIYRDRFELDLRQVSLNGHVCMDGPLEPILNLPILQKARADAIHEGLRWGESYTFFLAPGIISWLAPVIDGDHLYGGISGGEVVPLSEGVDLSPALNYLVEAGARRRAALDFLHALPQLSQETIRSAGDFLFTELYERAPLNTAKIARNREHAQQQRQIAECIHQNKALSNRMYSYDEERALFSLIRVGDKPGARSLLNKLLASMFLDSPNVVMVQARAIEMTGYLVRAAIENSPMLENMLAYHTAWTERILHARSFESLCWEVRQILDDFMNLIFLHGYNRSNKKAQAILDFIASHYTERLSLEDISQAVGRSRYRVAHLIKEATGKTVVQHIKHMRVHKARELLMQTDLSYIDIAYQLGFSDQSYFIKQFREITGTTPAKYRQGPSSHE